MIQQFHSWVSIWTEQRHWLKRVHNLSVHRTIYSSQDMETTQVPINRQLVKKTWYIYIIEYYSGIKNSEILPFVAMWMNLENIVLSEISQERQILHVITYMWNLESQWMYITKQKRTHTCREQASGYISPLSSHPQPVSSWVNLEQIFLKFFNLFILIGG